MALQERVQALLEPLVEGLGYELVCLELHGSGAHALLRLYIDAPQGIGLDDCERVSREVSAALDVADPISGSYRLEVSSPGLDRPLAKPEHFRRFAGRQAKLQLRAPLNGRRRFAGRLLGLEQDEVVIEVDGSPWRLPLQQVEKARLVPEHDR
ncbi:MAG TPA: ribosome maturation factor RimP [Nevskiales bacterium]|jgi:ribosome maturation factor RimP|nr:ribosome maturation factor RimP [Nevskiales bacterium]